LSYAKDDPDAPNPSFSSLQEWLPVKSTKMDVTAQIAQYYLSDDGVPDVEFKDGQPVFASIPRPSPGQIVSQNRKILIFSEFPSMTGLLRNVGSSPAGIHYQLLTK
jgi:TATA-binding protein-associated factor